MTAERSAKQEQILSDQIKSSRGGVLSNTFQGSDKKVLFVCSMGILRSATAARIYARKYNTRCAGTLKEALIPLTQLLIDWSDECIFVNKLNYYDACYKFNEKSFKHKSKILDIPDQYSHMHPKLIRAFKDQFEPLTKNKLEK